MSVMPSGRAVLVEAGSSSSSIALQRFDTLAAGYRLYAEQDADDDVTSLSNSSGSIVERYAYGPYGAVTVENPDGTTRGTGAASASYYGSAYLYQGMRLDVVTGTYDGKNRVYDVSLDRWLQQDPAGYVDGPNTYQFVGSSPTGRADPSGLDWEETAGGYVPDWLADGSAGFADGLSFGLTAKVRQYYNGGDDMADTSSTSYGVGHVAGKAYGIAVTTAATGGGTAVGGRSAPSAARRWARPRLWASERSARPPDYRARPTRRPGHSTRS